MEEKHYQNDATLEAMLARFAISQPKDWKCGGGNNIERICINPNCQEYSLICN